MRVPLLLSLLALTLFGGCATSDYGPRPQEKPAPGAGDDVAPLAPGSPETLAPGEAPAGSPPLVEQSAATAAKAAAAYGRRWANWRADELVEHNRALARLSTGAARANSLAAARESGVDGAAGPTSGDEAFGATGKLVGVAAVKPSDSERKTFVVVTRETPLQDGTAEIGATQHLVYRATTRRANGRWLISTWQPLP